MLYSLIDRLREWIDFLRTDPIGFVVYVFFTAVTILLSLILHEVAHGYVAWRCGDPTAKWMGRLSLDPRKHLDPLGTISMIFIGIGWAKPVPVNPRNFSNYRRDDFLVSIAGIATNLMLFIACTALSVGINGLMWNRDFLTTMKDSMGTLEYLVSPYYMIGYGIAYGELDPMWTANMAAPWLQYVQRFLLLMAQTNLALAVFNLLPIPPLDGYHLLNDTLLKGRLQLNQQTFQIAHFVLLILCFSGALGGLLSTVNTTVYSAVLNLFLKITGGV
ncbi:MAG: site-2 protease family protein [Clostridia bacterium]|nr:site-2 protease family protein [Clostridia bacterium]